jgi:hypothetical protein
VQRSHFFHDAVGKHFFDAAIDPFVKLRAFPKDEDPDWNRARCARLTADSTRGYNLRALLGGRSAGEQTNLKSASDASPVLYIDLTCNFRIKLKQLPAQLIET